MKYFNNCTTTDQAKNLFRELCKKLHPDTSGSDTQNEFIQMFKEFKTFKPSDKETDFNKEEFYDMIKNFDVLNDIKISFVGSFIWLEDIEAGATYLQRNTIKSISLADYKSAKFAPVKKSWYFAPENYQQKSKGKKSLDEIKNKYGCKSFKTVSNLQIK